MPLADSGSGSAGSDPGVTRSVVAPATSSPTIGAATSEAPPIRAQRIAEVVADRLRSRILSGELQDGARLPKEDELRLEYPVAKTSLREAMRILESEGLVTVLRGKRGGATVHIPRAENAAYTLGLILATNEVPLADLAGALRQLEPLCAAMCARREDRHTLVIPRLRGALQKMREAADDSLRFTVESREFHEVLVNLCGNQTIILLVGALETLWSAQVTDQVMLETKRGFNRGTASRLEAVEEHQQVLACIEAGDAAGAAAAIRAHLSRVEPRRVSHGDGRVTMRALRVMSQHFPSPAQPSPPP